jgi:Asp-tRNA(Asn)/Glu-tRNA(Gln) amidotransferase A subunit family amidase
MARTVADCAALLAVMAAGGPDPTPLMPPPKEHRARDAAAWESWFRFHWVPGTWRFTAAEPISRLRHSPGPPQ